MKFAIEGTQSRAVDFDAVMNILKQKNDLCFKGIIWGVPGKAGNKHY